MGAGLEPGRRAGNRPRTIHPHSRPWRKVSRETIQPGHKDRVRAPNPGQAGHNPAPVEGRRERAPIGGGTHTPEPKTQHKTNATNRNNSKQSQRLAIRKTPKPRPKHKANAPNHSIAKPKREKGKGGRPYPPRARAKPKRAGGKPQTMGSRGGNRRQSGLFG